MLNWHNNRGRGLMHLLYVCEEPIFVSSLYFGIPALISLLMYLFYIISFEMMISIMLTPAVIIISGISLWIF